jgi:hypothetical protein
MEIDLTDYSLKDFGSKKLKKENIFTMVIYSPFIPFFELIGT